MIPGLQDMPEDGKHTSEWQDLTGGHICPGTLEHTVGLVTCVCELKPLDMLQ